MTFEVKILGCNSASFAHGRHHTSQVVCYDKHLFLVDCGEGTQIWLSKYKVKYNRISHIFISHLHGDHYLGLTGLISTMHLSGRQEPLHIIGPPGLDEIITLSLRLSDTRLQFPVSFQATTHQELTVVAETPYLQVSSFPLSHRIPCTGFLFQEKPHHYRLIREKLPPHLNSQDILQLKQGKNLFAPDGSLRCLASDVTLPPKPVRSYAYCSDTIFLPALADVVQGVSLLYHESTFLDALAHRAAETYHTTASQAATLAAMAQVQTLMLGHYSSRYKDPSALLEEALAVFPRTLAAEEGKTYAILHDAIAVSQDN